MYTNIHTYKLCRAYKVINKDTFIQTKYLPKYINNEKLSKLLLQVETKKMLSDDNQEKQNKILIQNKKNKHVNKNYV